MNGFLVTFLHRHFAEERVALAMWLAWAGLTALGLLLGLLLIQEEVHVD